MNFPDANVLLYAVNESDPRCDEARGWLDGQLSDGKTVAFVPVVLLAFLRLSTKIGLFPQPLSVESALEIVRAWIDAPSAVVVDTTARHFDVLAGLLASVGTGGNLVNDAHLAALALEHGGTVITYDTDFTRFEGVASRPPRAW